MKKIFKRVSAAVVLTAVMFDVPEKVAAAEIVQSGSCGDNITWTLDTDGVLTISGTGTENHRNKCSAQDHI